MSFSRQPVRQPTFIQIDSQQLCSLTGKQLYAARQPAAEQLDSQQLYAARQPAAEQLDSQQRYDRLMRESEFMFTAKQLMIHNI